MGVSLLELVYLESESSHEFSIALRFIKAKETCTNFVGWMNCLGWFCGHNNLYNLIRAMVNDDPLNRPELGLPSFINWMRWSKSVRPKMSRPKARRKGQKNATSTILLGGGLDKPFSAIATIRYLHHIVNLYYIYL